MEINCISCGNIIKKPHPKRVRCIVCYKSYRKKYLKDYNIKHEYFAQKRYQRKNKDRYRYLKLKKLGNPEQDKKILLFLKNKRENKETKNYKKLPLYLFKKQNEAESYGDH